jgi:hypothetical protein
MAVSLNVLAESTFYCFLIALVVFKFSFSIHAAIDEVAFEGTIFEMQGAFLL